MYATLMTNWTTPRVIKPFLYIIMLVLVDFTIIVWIQWFYYKLYFKSYFFRIFPLIYLNSHSNYTHFMIVLLLNYPIIFSTTRQLVFFFSFSFFSKSLGLAGLMFSITLICNYGPSKMYFIINLTMYNKVTDSLGKKI